jgi:hypothetical protein
MEEIHPTPVGILYNTRGLPSASIERRSHEEGAEATANRLFPSAAQRTHCTTGHFRSRTERALDRSRPLGKPSARKEGGVRKASQNLLDLDRHSHGHPRRPCPNNPSESALSVHSASLATESNFKRIRHEQRDFRP